MAALREIDSNALGLARAAMDPKQPTITDVLDKLAEKDTKPTRRRGPAAKQALSTRNPRKRKSDATTTTTTTTTKKPKKPKTTSAANEGIPDVSGITLGEEEEGRVAVYMTCDEVRREMRALLVQPSVTKAGLARVLCTMYPPERARPVTSANLSYFLKLEGPRSGNTCVAFYAGYCLFEKVRVKLRIPKSEWRLEMEVVHGFRGLNVTDGPNTAYVGPSNSELVVNQYGGLTSYRT